MDTKRPHGDESSAVRDGVRTHFVSRRNFARAGLSGSTVLLGSLASRPVLGAASVRCTVSGQMSGNLSREALPQPPNCRSGGSVATWNAAVTWPSPFTKGTAPQPTNCNFTGGTVQGTLFNSFTPGAGVPALASAFFRAVFNPPGGGGGTCVVQTSGTRSASMLQVLRTTSTTNPGEQFRLGRIVVASLLNVAQYGSDYPVTYHTVIAMFNAAFQGIDYVEGDVQWEPSRVIAYLDSLLASATP